MIILIVLFLMIIFSKVEKENKCGFNDKINAVVVDKNIETSFWDKRYVIVIEDDYKERTVLSVTQDTYYSFEIGFKTTYSKTCNLLFKIE